MSMLRHLLKPNLKTINWIWFWTFLLSELMSRKLQIALQRYSDFQTITVIVPLQKFREKLSKGAITNDHSNGSTSPSRLSTNVTITEKPKNPRVFSRVAVSTRNRTNKQLWQKVAIPFWLQKKYNILWASQI